MVKLTRSAIMEASIAAAKKWLSVEYARYSEKLLPVVMAKAADDFRQINRITEKDGKGDDTDKVITPFSLWSVGNIGLDTEKAGLKKRLAGNGVMTGRDVFHGVGYFDTMRPAIVGIGCAFIASDFDEVVIFAEALLNAAPAITLVIESDTGFLTETTLLIDPDMSIPPPDGGDLGGNYRFELPLRLRTYIGTHSEQRLIRKLKISVKDVASSTDLKYSSNITPGLVFEGAYDTLLEEQIEYQDLFDKASKHYKYDYSKEVGK